MINVYYVLDENGNPVPAAAEEYLGWFENSSDLRAIDFTEIGAARISTAFVGINQHPLGDACGGLRLRKPKLYETVILGGLLDGHSWKYSTKQEAIDGHQQAVREVKKTFVMNAPTPL